MAALLALAVLALLPLPGARAHGFMAEPRSRNYVRDWQSCPHCVNYGGPWPASKHGKLTWPKYVAPVCGERELDKAGKPEQSYVAGEVISITVFITAQHGGRHTFRLCPRPDASEGCLEEHTLQRVDGHGHHSWTPTEGGPVPGGRWRKDVLGGQGGESYTWRYRLPAGVTCERCVLQWWWTAANSCRVPGAPSYVHSDEGMLACDEPGPYPEQFWNCADITIEPPSRGKKHGSGAAAAAERLAAAAKRRAERKRRAAALARDAAAGHDASDVLKPLKRKGKRRSSGGRKGGKRRASSSAKRRTGGNRRRSAATAKWLKLKQARQAARSKAARRWQNARKQAAARRRRQKAGGRRAGRH